MKKRKKILFRISIIVAVFSVYLLSVSARSFKPPNKDELQRRINYLQRVVNEPLNAGEINQLRSQSHEFVLFSYAYTCYALTSIALQQPEFA
ncbi:hypothetical protein GC194_07060 [bacterium]|nr:hypothetical protein [bacterium]